MPRARLDRANLFGVRAAYARMPEATFEEADLAFSVFRFAELRGVRLIDANLRGVDFRSTDLSAATFDGVDLDSVADRSGAILDDAVFCDALYEGEVVNSGC